MPLIRKDILFSKKWLYLYIICIVCLPLTISVFPMVIRFFHVEDGLETKQFLRSLPISKWQPIGCRVLLSTGLVFVAAIVHTGMLIILGWEISFNDLVTTGFTAIGYLAVFILVAYHIGYQKALFLLIPITYFIF